MTRELAYVRINISSNTWNGYITENQEERCFFNETLFLFWCYTLWKLGSSNCCIFEMKHAMGMETCTKIYFLFIFNLELIRIHKTMLFWLYNLMMSLWRPSILVQVWIKNESIILFLKLPSWTCTCVLHR